MRRSSPLPATTEIRRKARAVIRLLEKTYPHAQCSLHYHKPWQLVVAVILSAQCTDKRVNMVTPELWKKYRSPGDMANAPIAQLEQDIRSTGFYKNKAKSIQGCCRILAEQYQNRLPATLEELLTLPGVGRKTANVVLGEAFGKPAVVVDTHVTRITNLLGLTRQQDPVKIEFELMDILPRDKWSRWAHWLIHHGRAVCVARRPQCGTCPLQRHCDYFQKNIRHVPPPTGRKRRNS